MTSATKALFRLRCERCACRCRRALQSNSQCPFCGTFRSTCTDVDIDLISPYGVGPPLGDVDVAVVYSRPTVTDLVTDLLWPERPGILCHPNIAARHAGKSLGDFIEANEIVHVRIADLPRHHVWSQFARQAGLGPINYERGLVFDTAVLAVQYAMSGQGLALVDPNLFQEEIRTGRLVRPFAVAVDDGYGYYLITHPEGLGDTAIALFISPGSSSVLGVAADAAADQGCTWLFPMSEPRSAAAQRLRTNDGSRLHPAAELLARDGDTGQRTDRRRVLARPVVAGCVELASARAVLRHSRRERLRCSSDSTAGRHAAGSFARSSK